MRYVVGVERTQSVLFAQSLEESVSEESPVRFIDAYVGCLDLVELGFAHATPSQTGRPAYDPGDLLRLYIYGYLNRVRSSRRLEKEAERNVEVMWLLRKLRPDFKTIADFRALNRAALAAVFKHFVAFCRGLDLYGGEVVAVDGSKFRASNSRKRIFTEAKLTDRLRRIKQHLEEHSRAYLALLDRNDQEPEQTPELSFKAHELKARIAQLQQREQDYRALQTAMKEHQVTQIALTDPDARLMPQSQAQGGGTVVAYNVQTVVDAKHKLIATYAVTTEGNDLRQLTSMATQAKEALAVESLEVLADTGYYDGDEVARCEAEAIEAYIPKPENSSKSHSQGLFSKADFHYDPATDCYRCPAGQTLTYRFTAVQDGRELKHYYTSACTHCEMRPQCTKRADGPRQVTRLVNEEALERMEQRMAADPQKFKLRKTLAEHPFGTLKRAWNHGYFLLRTLSKVNAETALSALTYNIRRAINILSLPVLMAALA
jgi:transposase